MQNNDAHSRNPAASPANQPHAKHRVISDEWLQHAINGIKEMHSNEEARREVANRLF